MLLRSCLYATLVMLLGCPENALKRVEPDTGPGERELIVSPEVIDFGLAAAGEPRTEAFTLTSVGSEAVHLDTLTVQGSSAFTLTSPGALTLDPGEDVSVVVTWTPQSYADSAHVLITSDAITPQLQVSLSGEGLYAGIEVTPSSLAFTSEYGESSEQMLTVKSIGNIDLVVSQTLIAGAAFSIYTGADSSAGDGAFTLAPGAQRSLPVTYTPPGEDDVSTGNVWFTSNTVNSVLAVPLRGEAAVPCYGLGEAWDRGVLGVGTNGLYEIVLQNDDTKIPICMDQWYVFLSDVSQDAIAGDPDYDLSGDYPFGSVTIDPGDEADFIYNLTTDYAWWCIEHEQYTQPFVDYDFRGARAPTALLARALDGDQEGIWAREAAEPVVAIGRTVHYSALDAGASGPGGVVVWNMGDVATPTTVTETLPAGFEASAFSLEPESSSVNSDGSITYAWEVDLDPRQVSSTHGNTLYDEETITWTVTRTGDCDARLTAPEATASWQDSEGTQLSTANPLVIHCE
jgi:hypothetical protein